MFRLSERYLALVDEREIAIPAGYREHLGQLPRIEAALAAHPLATVPCHNDLLADNYLDDGERLWLVDWEYSGNNDPTFELGNTCQELGYDEAQATELCAAYFGEASPALLARMHLQMIMSDVGWTLWAAIQARISTIDYDFTGWAEERWARASAALDGSDFEGVAGVRAARMWIPPELTRASDRRDLDRTRTSGGDDGRDAGVEDIDLELGAIAHARRQVDVADRPLDGRAVGDAPQAADDLAIEADGFAAVDRDVVGAADDDGAEPAPSPIRARPPWRRRAHRAR